MLITEQSSRSAETINTIKMEKIYDGKNVKVYYSSIKNYIMFEWQKYYMSLDELKEPFAVALSTAKAKGVKTYATDVRNVKDVLSPECIDWWLNVHVPVLSGMGLKRILTVPPIVALGRLATNTWQKKEKKTEVQMLNGIECIDVQINNITDFVV